MEHQRDARREPARDHPNDFEFEIEVSDLAASPRASAHTTTPTPRAPQRRAARFTPWLRRQAVITSAVLVALLAILLGFYGGLVGSRLHALIFPPPPPPLQLQPQLAGMRCLLDAAWSPESARVALLGEQFDGTCPDDSLSTRAGLVVVYDANTARPLATIHADDLIIPTIKAMTNPREADFTVAVALHYEHVLWSPDGKRLAITFWADTSLIGTSQSLPDGEPAIIDGVLLVDANGAQPHVLTGQASAYGPVEMLWDLGAGHLIASPAASYNPNGFGMLTPALAYRWQPDGTLAPVGAQLNADTPPPAPPLSPVGAPDGNSSFSIWQPGYVAAAALQLPQAVGHLPGVYDWQAASLAAWSPDARYLLDGSAPAGLLVRAGTPQPSRDVINTYGLGFGSSTVWRLPLRDAGLAAILRTVDPNNQEGMAVAWRPDGRVVAAYTDHGPDGSVSGTQPVILYGCASGKAFAMLHPVVAQTSALNGQDGLLRWSPDGTHLLLFDTRLGTPLVWGPRNLA